MNDLLGTPIHPKAQLQMIAESEGALEGFEDWLTVLKKKKVATTDSAWRRRLSKVRDLMRAGHDMKEVWERSADSGWTGLFPVKRDEDKPKKENFDPALSRPGESMEQFIERMRARR